MEERPQNKLKLLEIQDLLLRETDDEHHLTVQEIIDPETGEVTQPLQ